MAFSNCTRLIWITQILDIVILLAPHILAILMRFMFFKVFLVWLISSRIILKLMFLL